MKKLILSILLSTPILYACGGGDDPAITTSSPTPINPGEASNLPPDPGLAGRSTLVGIDSNTNGVRDDVERFIGLNYGDTPALANALNQYAKVLQETTSLTDTNEILQNDQKALQAISCVYSLFDVEQGDEANSLIREVVASQLNTKERMLDFGRVGDALAGQVIIDQPTENPCQP